MILPLFLDGDLHVRAPWHADLVVRARGADVEIDLPRRLDLWRLWRSSRSIASFGGTPKPAAPDGPTSPRARLDSMTDLFALRLAVSVRGHRVAERDATAGRHDAAWKPRWRGVLPALFGRRRAVARPMD